MNHLNEKTLLLYVLESADINDQRQTIEEHLKECAGCDALGKQMREYYEQVDQYQEEMRTSDKKALTVRDKIIPFSSFIDKPTHQAEDNRLPIRLARFMVLHPVMSSMSFAAALVLGLLLLYPKDSSVPTDTNPTYARPVDEFLVAYNKSGEELWRVHVGPRYDNLDLEAGNKKLLDLADVDGDGKNEVFCGFFQIFGEPVKNRKRILTCYNSDGNERWRIDFHRDVTFGNESFYDDYQFTSIIAGDFDHNGRADLIAHVENATQYPGAILRIDPATGEVLSQYWHPGYLKFLDHGDIDGDGIDEIFCGGQNYLTQDAALAVFDPRYISGYSPISEEHRPHGMEPATEKYYILFPPTELENLPNFKGTDVRHFFPVRDEGVEIWVQEGVTPEGPLFYFIYYFDSIMKCRKVSPIDSTKKILNQIQLTPQMTRQVRSREYLEELSRKIKYWDGEKFVAQAVMNRKYTELLQAKPLP